MVENKFATEVIDLPSQGRFYPEANELSKGKLEIRYMTAKEEDILTSTNLIKKGLAIDMVLRSVVVTPINYDSLLVGDKNALMVATRILAYGKDYAVKITCPRCETETSKTIDLSQIQHKEVDLEKFPKGVNEFDFELPVQKVPIKFKFLNGTDEKAIDEEIKGLKRTNVTGIGSGLSTRFKHVIVALNNIRDMQKIREFVDKQFLAADSFALRTYMNVIQPDVDMEFNYDCSNSDCGYEERMRLPLTVEFFWPTAADKKVLHEELFNIIMGSEGAFSYSDVYDMPVYLRKFNVRLLEKVLAERKKKLDQIDKGKSPINIGRPAIRPR